MLNINTVTQAFTFENGPQVTFIQSQKQFMKLTYKQLCSHMLNINSYTRTVYFKIKLTYQNRIEY